MNFPSQEYSMFSPIALISLTFFAIDEEKHLTDRFLFVLSMYEDKSIAFEILHVPNFRKFESYTIPLFLKWKRIASPDVIMANRHPTTIGSFVDSLASCSLSLSKGFDL